MIERFTKKPFVDRVKDTAFLLKNSFSIISEDKDIIKPTIHMVIFSSFLTTWVFLCLFSFFSGRFIGLGVLGLVLFVFFLVPFKYFYYIRQKGDQSWIVYNTIIGQNISYRDAHSHTKNQKSSLRKIALIEILIRYAGNQKNNKSMLIRLFLAALEEIWDLLSHYMIPGVVVEQKPLTEIVPQIKALRKNVPATLAGVFGIDFVGNVLTMLLFPLRLIILAFSFGLAYVSVDLLPNTVITLAGYSFSWVPILVGFYIWALVEGVLKKLVESTKVIYFTLFYCSIRCPSVIKPSLRTQITNYLQMKNGV